MDIQSYKAEFENLRPSRVGGRSRPHKGSMLLAVIDLIEQGAINRNQIPFNDALRDAFSERFALYRQGNDKDDPAQPYFYLSSSDFWHLVPVAGREDELEQRRAASHHGSTKQIKSLIEYAYLDEELFELLQNDVYRSILADVLEADLVSNEEAFKRWCNSIGKSEKTISNYSTALKGVISRWAAKVSGFSLDLFEIQDGVKLDLIYKNLLTDDVFVERDRVGKGMYSAALKLYEKFLEQQATTSVARDLKEIEERPIDLTEKEILISARRGQGLFRRRVLNEWNGRCAVTRYGDERFLIASHIKPWRQATDGERLDRFNGLPLIPNLDKGFDMGLISFDSSGRILISKELEEPTVLGVTPDLILKGRRKHFEYLEYHRNELFKS